MNISVVIPNYNGVHLFPETLPALKQALKISGKEYEIIIVDDCSTDGSIAYLNQYHPEIITIQNSVNSGFSVTVNKGIFASKYALVFLLNSDVRLEPGYFEPQFKYFDQPDTFGVMGKIVGWQDDEIQDGAKFPEFTGFKLKTSLNYLPEDPLESSPVYTFYLSGANALIRREKLILLDGVDELYSPFYMEDVDLSVRAWRSGHKCYFEAASICHHKTSESIRSKDSKKYVKTIYNRNKLFFHAIHFEGLAFVGWAGQVFFEFLFRLITFRWDYLSSVNNLIKGWQIVNSSRKNFKNVCQNTGICLSIWDVGKLIEKSVKKDRVRFFRS